MPVRCKPTIPRNGAKIAIVGEAPGEEEAKLGIPFSGKSGQELTRMLHSAGIDRKEVALTNVFMDRPDNNDWTLFCGPKSEGTPGLPPIAKGKYLLPEYAFELDRLRMELEELSPNVIVAAGNIALWALTGRTGITNYRGTVLRSTLVEGAKILATYHPAYILRVWKERIVLISDLVKAATHSTHRNIERPRRELWIEPTIPDLEKFYDLHLQDATHIAFDTETFCGAIDCIGFAPSNSVALVVPLCSRYRPEHLYWPDRASLFQAIKFCKTVLEDPNTVKIAQNGLYDIQYCLRWGIKVRNATEDTMLLQHALQPEMPKSLGFLGSVYTDDVAWKELKPKGEDTLKREE